MNFTQTQINEIVAEAKTAAYAAASKYFQEKLGGQDQYACGFAWVNVYRYNGEKIRGNTKLGKMLRAAGMEQDYTKAFSIWNPSGLNCQNIDTKEVGANAAAQVFTKYGFVSYAGSRLD